MSFQTKALSKRSGDKLELGGFDVSYFTKLATLPWVEAVRPISLLLHDGDV